MKYTRYIGKASKSVIAEYDDHGRCTYLAPGITTKWLESKLPEGHITIKKVYVPTKKGKNLQWYVVEKNSEYHVTTAYPGGAPSFYGFNVIAGPFTSWEVATSAIPS